MRRLLFFLMMMVLLRPGRPFADEMITSDTVDYCDALAARLEQHEMPPSVRVLLVEGRAMCERGHVIGGLRRIRLAMMIVHRQLAPP